MNNNNLPDALSDGDIQGPSVTDRIERLALIAKGHRDRLSSSMAILEAGLNRVTDQELPGIRKDLEATATAEAELLALVEQHPAQFAKPRSITVHGYKCGYAKDKGKVVIDDESKTIGLIRKQLPADQAELLITIIEKVHKPGVADLTAVDLKRLAIRIEGGSDKAFVKSMDNDLKKLIALLLKGKLEQ